MKDRLRAERSDTNSDQQTRSKQKFSPVLLSESCMRKMKQKSEYTDNSSLQIRKHMEVILVWLHGRQAKVN